MSGPKVVRVVTREELVVAGTAVQARLDAAIAQWKRDCGDAKLDDVEATKKRRDQLAAMLAADRFAEFGQAARNEIEFLETDAAQRRERAAQARAAQRLRQSSGRELARSMLKAGSNLNPQMRAELEKSAAGGLSVAEMDETLSRARQALFQVAAQGPSSDQKALAQRLGATEAEVSFELWKANSTKPDLRLQAVFTLLAELEALSATEAGALEAQLRSVQEIDNEATRDMRLDTLLLSLCKVRDGIISKKKLQKQVQLLAVELSAAGGGADALETLHSATPSLNLEQLQALVTLGHEELAKAQTAVAIAARRKAILEGLQQLGYQVQEGLATMSADMGRLVVRSPVSGEYGVEVMTGANQRVQIRSVAFDAARDTAQDAAEEQRWCGDFGKLQSALRASGCEVVVEKALGVGAVPLRLVNVVEEHLRSQTSPGVVGRSR